jgi:hypothetical protein
VSGDPIVSWMRNEWRKEAFIAFGVGALAVSVLALLIAGLVAIA